MATNQKVNISLAFMADTSQARAQLQSLQSQLDGLAKNTSLNSPLVNTDNLKTAISDVTKLSSVLKNSMTNTGNLDLTKFTSNLKAANLDAEKIAASLGSLGPQGVQAFSQLSQAVLTAEVPLKRVNKTVQNFMDGLKRTAGWQIQSTMIHKFTGALQQAYGYAQDLNESLTNIRVVTGKSTDEMAKFAKEANKAAKELSTTTTSYTDAALIFYQQGLDGDAVKQRTDTVIKMSNVTGQSAEEVSSYMTAIWNNFYDGSKSLEHYADVITALGAATASSSEEIAEGLEKFAAIGNTVGLSYEYATSALATVVAQTRQSADTVGTAFKTLFARIQDLEVGKTLDDGTTLGKYSQALASIGVNIKDASGQVKDMDIILDEMGNKWKTIDKNTQIAVAQAVAGTRQYSQLVALMDNYDTFKQNLTTAGASEGALQEQADIYAESWEAARKRVRASLEGLYDKLINDDTFIDLNNSIADLIENITKVVDAMGGFKTLLPAIGVMITKYFGKSISSGLQNFSQGFIDMAATMPKVGKKLERHTSEVKNKATRDSFNNQLKDLVQDETVKGSATADAIQNQQKAQDALIKKQEELLKGKTQLTEQEKAYAQEVLKVIDVLNKEAVATAEVAQKAEQKKKKTFDNIKFGDGKEEKERAYKTRTQRKAVTKDIKDRFNNNTNIKATGKEYEKLQKSMTSYAEKLSNISGISVKHIKRIIETAKNGEELFEALNTDLIETEKQISALSSNIGVGFEQDVQQATQDMEDFVEKAGDAAFASENAAEGTQTAVESFGNLNGETMKISDGFITATQGLMSLTMAINAVQGLGSIWSDEDASVGEKILQTIMTLGMVVPGVASAISAFTAIQKAATIAKEEDTVATNVDTVAKIANAIATALAAIPVWVLIAAITALVAIVAIVAIAYANYTKKLEQNAESAKKNYESSLENLKSKIEEKQAVDNLVNSYQELKQQYEEGSISIDEMRQKTYELLKEYGDQDAALKALIGDYSSLDKLLSEEQTKANTKVVQAAQSSKSNLKDVINTQQALTSSNGNFWFAAIDSGSAFGTATNGILDFNTGMSTDKEEKAYFEELAKAIGITDTSKYYSGDLLSGSIDMSQYSDQIIANWEEIQRINNKYSGLASHNIYKTFAGKEGFFTQIEDSVSGFLEQATDAQKAALEKAIQAVGNISSSSEYQSKLEKIKNEMKNSGLFYNKTNQELESLIDEYFISTGDVTKAGFARDNKIIDALKYNISDIEKEIENFSDDEKNYLYLHLDTASAYTDLNQFMEDYRNEIDINNKSNSVTTLSGYIQKENLSKDDIKNIYQDASIKNQLGYSEEEFNRLDATTQKVELVNTMLKSQSDLMNQDQKQLLDNIKAVEKEYSRWAENMTKQGESFAQSGYFTNGETAEEVQAAIEKYGQIVQAKEDNIEIDIELTEKEKDIISILKDGHGYQDKYFQNVAKGAKQHKQYTDKLNATKTALEQCKNASKNYGAIIKSLNELQSDLNKNLDNIQKAYSSLTDTISGYNENGVLTLDQLQSLTEMSPEYLSCLEFEEGQLKLNTNALLNQVKAKLYTAKATLYQTAQSRIQAYLAGEVTEASDYETAAQWRLAAATTGSAEAAEQAENAWTNYLNTLSKGELEDGVITEIIRQTETQASMYDKMINGLDSNYDYILSGNKDKNKNKKSKKYFEDEFDRYWEFTKAIEAVENAMSNLEEQQDRLYGKELIDNLTQVNSLLAQQEANYKALAAAQEEEAEELRNTLSQYGAEFDENGALSNYAAITSSMFSQYAGQEESEGYEAFKKALDRYDALFYSEMVDTANNTAQVTRKIMENNLKIWEIDLQINLDLRQSQRDWNDFIHNLNADIKSATKDIGKEMAYNLSQIDTYNLVDGTIATDIQKIENINAEIDKLKNGGVSQFYGSLSEAENALAEANEQLRSDTLEVKSLFEATWESYLEGIDQAAEDLEKINQEYETLNEQLEHQIQLTNLLYGDAAYDKMAKIYEAQEKASLNQLDSLRKQSDFWLEQYKAAAASDGEDSESAQKALEKYKESIQALNAEEENYIQILQNKYNNAIDSIVEKAKSNIQESRTNWDDINKQNEGIYDDTERLYQLNSMQTKWNKLISNTTGLKNQQALAKVMQEQMSYLEEKTRLSEYDIGLAEKELSIAQAQIALEEAQNSKNSMKMTRGADGNWSYQYVADDAAVEDKQQALLDTINDKYNYIKDANRKALEDIMSYEEEYLTRYSEIMKNTTLSQEEKETKTAQLYQTYYGETGILTNAYRQSQLTESQLNVATYEQLTALYQADETNYENMTANEKILVDAFKNGQIQNEKDVMDYGKQCNDESLDYWNSTAKQMSDAWNADDGESIKSQVQQSMEECKGFLNDYNEAIKLGCEAAKEDFTKIEDAVIDINTAINNLSNATDNYLATASQNLETYRSNLDSASKAWDELKGKVGENITTMREYEIAANNAIAKAQAATAAAKEVGSGGSGIPTTDKTGNEISKNYGWVVTELGNTVESETTGYTLAEAKQKASDVLDQEERYGTPSDALKRYYIEPDGKWVPFASGGYTGEWGDPTNSNGKLAMLHQKELVLNADDTENILKTVSFVRDLAASIGSTLMNNLFGIAASMSGITPASVSNITTNNGDSSNNVYNITAEFPNASNVDDIREAILNLPNYVSQFINR